MNDYNISATKPCKTTLTENDGNDINKKIFSRTYDAIFIANLIKDNRSQFMQKKVMQKHTGRKPVGNLSKGPSVII